MGMEAACPVCLWDDAALGRGDGSDREGAPARSTSSECRSVARRVSSGVGGSSKPDSEMTMDFAPVAALKVTCETRR
jgi:hypothetical protein